MGQDGATASLWDGTAVQEFRVSSGQRRGGEQRNGVIWGAGTAQGIGLCRWDGVGETNLQLSRVSGERWERAYHGSPWALLKGCTFLGGQRAPTQERRGEPEAWGVGRRAESQLISRKQPYCSCRGEAAELLAQHSSVPFESASQSKLSCARLIWVPLNCPRPHPGVFHLPLLT